MKSDCSPQDPQPDKACAKALHETILPYAEQGRLDYGEIGKAFYEFRQQEGWRQLGFDHLKDYLVAYNISTNWAYHLAKCYSKLTLELGIPTSVWTQIGPSRWKECLAIASKDNVWHLIKMARDAASVRELSMQIRTLRGDPSHRAEDGGKALEHSVLYQLVRVEGDPPDTLRRSPLVRTVYEQCFFYEDSDGNHYISRQ